MPNINIEVSEELLRAVRIRCATEGVSQKEFVVRALVNEASGVKAENRVKQGRVVKPITVPHFETEPITLPGTVVTVTEHAREMIPNERCQCGAGVYPVKNPNTGVVKWKCIGPQTHTMSPREAKEKP